jgi:hypothetical protein
VSRKAEIVAVTDAGDRLRCAAKVCSGPGLQKMREWLQEAGTDALIVNGEGVAPPIVVLGWEVWAKLVELVR